MSDESIIPEDDATRDEMLAAELSLGLLTGDELAQMKRRLLTDQKFARLVEGWNIRLTDLTLDIEPIEPPKGLFKKITSNAYPDSPKRLWQQLSIFPAILGAGAAALVLIVALQFGGYMSPNAPSPSYVARVVSQDATLVVAAAYVEDGGRLFVERQTGESAQGRSFELWLIAGDNAPLSLGVLASSENINEITIPQEYRALLVGATLAISDEPAGGSPTGGPTGAILAAGEITLL